MIEQAHQLITIFGIKERLNDDERHAYQQALALIAMHYRLTLLLMHKEAKTQGITDDELNGYASSPA